MVAHYFRIGLVLLAALAGVGLRGAVPPQTKEKRGPEPTHRVVAETVYYTTGPQQARAPDGKLKLGTQVTVLRKAGSYSQVRTADGLVAYVASDALKAVEAPTKIEITDDARAVAQSNNRFAIDLYKGLREREGNLFFSPASISAALAMTYAGAEGATEKQMATVLHLELAEPQLHEGFATLSTILNSGAQGYRLTMANRLWAQESYPFRPEFVTTTRQHYGAEIAKVDFRQTEEARDEINRWVEQQTEGKIEELLPPGILEAMTRLVLTNAIYFKGAWAEEFSKQATEEAPFHLSGRQVKAPLMYQTDDFRYGQTDTLEVLELPYAGNDLSMLVLLPKERDGLSRLENQLSAENLEKWTSRLAKREVRVYLPRFKLSSQFKLGETLRSLGMTLAFSEKADFSGMSSAEDLLISEVIHKAYVDVNEEGTEAAAATAVVIAPAAAVGKQEEPVVFRADHPFAFLIRDNRTGAVLFLGRVVNPSE